MPSVPVPVHALKAQYTPFPPGGKACTHPGCGKWIKRDWERHMQRHRPPTLKCPQCPHTTRQQSNLASHISAKHTHDKPHKCPYTIITAKGLRVPCRAAYNNPSGLTRHSNKVHPDEPKPRKAAKLSATARAAARRRRCPRAVRVKSSVPGTLASPERGNASGLDSGELGPTPTPTPDITAVRVKQEYVDADVVDLKQAVQGDGYLGNLFGGLPHPAGAGPSSGSGVQCGYATVGNGPTRRNLSTKGTVMNLRYHPYRAQYYPPAQLMPVQFAWVLSDPDMVFTDGYPMGER